MANGTLRNVKHIPKYMLESDDMYRTIEDHIKRQAVGTLLDQIKNGHIYSIAPYERISPWQGDENTARWEYGLKVAELVYCRNCKHYTADDWDICTLWDESVEPDGFCAWGKRRES